MRRLVGVVCAGMLMFGLAAAQDAPKSEKKAAKSEAKVANADAKPTAAAAKSKWIGTWKLNPAKSDMKADPNAPKALTVTVTRDDDKAFAWMAVGTDHANKPMKWSYFGKPDGKNNDLKGSMPPQKIAYTRQGDGFLGKWADKDDKQTGTEELSISEDGKTATAKINFKAPDGKDVSTTEIYEKVMPKTKAAAAAKKE